MESSHCCSVARVCTEVFHLALSIFPCSPMSEACQGTPVPEGAFLDCTVRLLCLFVMNLSWLQYHSILKWFYWVAFYFFPFSLSVWLRHVFLPRLAFLSLQLHCCLPSGETLAVTVKVEKQWDDLPPNPKKRKKDILWKFLQQKQRLRILQTPALRSVF